jgi:hypothetical protein
MLPLKLTLDWRIYVDDIPKEIQERQTQNLYLALRQLPNVERVTRIADPNVPDGAMGAAWLTDLLLTEVFPGSLSSIFNLVQQRLPGTPMDVEIEANGKRIVIRGVRPENFDATLDKIQQSMNEMSGK